MTTNHLMNLLILRDGIRNVPTIRDSVVSINWCGPVTPTPCESIACVTEFPEKTIIKMKMRFGENAREMEK